MEFQKKGMRFYKEDEDGKLLAEITYKPIDAETVAANHTYVHESLRSHGVAEQLVDRLAEEMKAEGKKIIPTCQYVKLLFGQKKEKYQDVMK